MSEIVGASRIPYHKDGTAVFTKYNKLVTYGGTGNGYGQELGLDLHEITPLGLEALNTLYRGSYARLQQFVMVFAVPQDIKGILPLIPGSTVTVEVSHDSLTGLDGIWEAGATLPDFAVPTQPVTDPNPFVQVFGDGPEAITDIRQPATMILPDYEALFSQAYESPSNGGIHLVDFRAVTALRFTASGSGNQGSTKLFLWGGPSSGEFSDYVQVQDIDLSVPLSHGAGFGTFPPHSSSERRVRVRNMSADLTATAIVVTASPDADLIPSSYRGLVLLSLDGELWEESIMLYNLSPSSVSPTIRIRLVAGGEFPEGPGQILLTATVGKWVA